MDEYEVEEQHTGCNMPEPEDVIVTFITGGFLVPLRRKLKHFVTVSSTNPRSRTFLRSSASIREEKQRHLQHHYLMIHPFSDCRAYWESFMFFVLCIMLFMIPIDNANQGIPIKELLLPLDLICVIDIVMTFASGYYQQNTRKIVLDPKKVAMNYLKTYFLIDLLSSLPIEVFVSLVRQDVHEFWYIKLITYLKLLRITTLVKYMDRIRDRRGYSIYKFKAIKLILIFLIVLTWATSIVAINEKLQAKSVTSKTTHGLLSSCFRAVCNIFLVGYGFHKLEELTDLLFAIVCMILGVFLQLFVYAEILNLLNSNLSAKNKYQHLMYQMDEYVSYKQLPDYVRKRMLLYFDYRFDKRYYKEREIFSCVSENLKQEIVLHTCQSLVENVDFFKDLPSALLIRIVKCMQSQIYLANDTIVKAGSDGTSMFFIFSGSVAVYTKNGKEICHLSDGQHFGEVALVMENEKRIAAVVAVECCELCELTRADFRRAIAPYPELNERIKQFAQQRVYNTLQLMNQKDLEDDGAEADCSNLSDYSVFI